MIDKLVEKIKKTEAPIVVGLGPTMKLIPPQLLEAA
jgi:orotidine-5'-phosphate decarboxylase